MRETFIKIESFIRNYCFKKENLIILDDVENYSDQKIEFVLTLGKLMISITVLANLTYDLLVVEFESEVVVRNKTKNFNNIKELFNELEMDFEEIIDF